MIGDSESDIEAGRAAGTATILLSAAPMRSLARIMQLLTFRSRAAHSR